MRFPGLYEVARGTRFSQLLAVTGDDPEIVAGDILVVDTVSRQGLQWRDVFPIVGAIASVTLIIERLAN